LCGRAKNDVCSSKPRTQDELEQQTWDNFLISNFRSVLNIVCILLGISPASDCGLPTFRNPLSVPSSKAGCRVRSEIICRCAYWIFKEKQWARVFRVAEVCAKWWGLCWNMTLSDIV
jgi:hypothetical protein